MNPTELAQEAGNKVEETTRNLKEKTRDLAGRAKSKVSDMGAAADLYLHEYPWSTVAMVAVFAGVIGFLLGRRD
jgi:ElaB/YqjD/DUF883 family membrane-anchored ribosome-binding protein